MDEDRPLLIVDRCMSGELPWDSGPSVQSYGFPCHWPHCDSRILHSPEKCPTCALFTEHQDERARLDVSNTGEMNRKWICPADRDRPASNQIWPGNRPEGYRDMSTEDDGDV